MFDFTVLLIPLLWFVPMIITIPMNCYSDARLDLPPSAILYSNFTMESCQCLMIQQYVSGFQYDSNDNSCYTFGNDSSRSDLRVSINAQVCFIDQTSTPSTTISTTLSPPPITTSTSASGNNYYQQETISLSNNAPLTSLLITITVPKTFGVSNPYLYTNFWGNAITTAINQTSDSIMYIYQLIPGRIIVTGQWTIVAQFLLTGQARSTSNDTYIIQISSYQDITGHF